MENPTPLIAIVDDEESVRKALERLLRSAGMKARIFASGEEFLAEATVFQPDCVLLDVQMPGLSGFEVMDRLRGSLPVVMITGNDSPERLAMAFKRGAAAYLPKPVDDHALIDAINGAIARAGAAKRPLTAPSPPESGIR